MTLPSFKEILSWIIDNIIQFIIAILLTYGFSKIFNIGSRQKRWLKKLLKGSRIFKEEQIFILTSSLETRMPDIESIQSEFTGIATTTSSSSLTYTGPTIRLPYSRHEDIEAVVFLYSMLHSLGVDIDLFFDNSYDKKANLFCFGGPGANQASALILRRVSEQVQFVTDKSETIISIKGGSTEYRRAGHHDYGVIIKIRNPASSDRYCIVLAGIWGTGTAGAAYYFTNNLKQLKKKFGARSFCVVLEVDTEFGASSAVLVDTFELPC